MSSNIPGNVVEHSGECRQTFQGTFSSIPGNVCITQGNEDPGPVQDFILLFLCKSRELGGKGSPRFPCVTPVVEIFPSDLFWAIVSYWAESHLFSFSCVSTKAPSSAKIPWGWPSRIKNPVKHPRWSSSAKTTTSLNSHQPLHLVI